MYISFRCHQDFTIPLFVTSLFTLFYKGKISHGFSSHVPISPLAAKHFP
jgi:hypothetical protein